MTNEEYMSNNPIQPDMTWEEFVEWFDSIAVATLRDLTAKNKPLLLEEYLEGDGVCNYVRYRYKEDTFRINEDKTFYLNDVESQYKSFKAIKRVITAILEGVEK